MHKDIKQILFDENQIKSRVSEIAKQIKADVGEHEVVFISVLKGSFMFFSDLVRTAETNCIMDFITVKSYGNGSTSGKLELVQDVSSDIKGKDVIIVEDILDTGNTLSFLMEHFKQKNPNSIRIAVLLEKKARRQTLINADYIGFDVDNLFVVGYGLDYAQKYRSLPYIGILKDEIWK